MPINIYFEDSMETITFICDDDWELPTQLESLEIWLDENKEKLNKGKKNADIGFGIRKDASGGGAVFTSESMKLFSEVEMDIYIFLNIGLILKESVKPNNSELGIVYVSTLVRRNKR